jgi:hypothetical protein
MLEGGTGEGRVLLHLTPVLGGLRRNESTLLDSEQSPAYAQWAVNHGLVKFYVWEVVNWREVVNDGAGPAMNQHGPYYYNRTTQMVNVTFWNIEVRGVDFGWFGLVWVGTCKWVARCGRVKNHIQISKWIWG